MYKLLSFFAFLAVAFAAPAPEPGALIAPALAYNYKAPLTYAAPLQYAALPGAPFAYNAPIAYNAPYAYSAYPAPIAYSKIY